MFFFIGGIQPKTVDLDKGTFMCPMCGLYKAHSKRIDHYISIFFIPIFRIKTGMPFIFCEKCGTLSDESNDPISKNPLAGTNEICKNCGQPLEKKFSFCPFCGKPRDN
jgi:RNA polymerase subunit RPABC4/transcription elongation factor Spt4